MADTRHVPQIYEARRVLRILIEGVQHRTGHPSKVLDAIAILLRHLPVWGA
jgi:hypothetical protein